MKVLIVEESPDLGRLWTDHLRREGHEADLTGDEDGAVAALRAGSFDVVVVNLDLPGSGAMAVADYAAYRQPGSRIVFVTSTSFFSDGSIFAMCPNACAFLPAHTAPEDLAAVVEFHGGKRVETA